MRNFYRVTAVAGVLGAVLALSAFGGHRVISDGVACQSGDGCLVGDIRVPGRLDGSPSVIISDAEGRVVSLQASGGHFSTAVKGLPFRGGSDEKSTEDLVFPLVIHAIVSTSADLPVDSGLVAMASGFKGLGKIEPNLTVHDETFNLYSIARQPGHVNVNELTNAVVTLANPDNGPINDAPSDARISKASAAVAQALSFDPRVDFFMANPGGFESRLNSVRLLPMPSGVTLRFSGYLGIHAPGQEILIRRK